MQSIQNSLYCMKIILLHINTMYTVPTAIPEGVGSQNLSSRSFSLTWSPPEAEGRNGIITRYAILISSNSMSRVFFTMQLNIVFPTQGFTVQPYRTYFIQVAAETEIGRGPYSELVPIYTPEDGREQHYNCQHVLYFC